MATRIKSKSFFDSLDTEEHRRWKRDRELRRRIPLCDIWRGCLGLAAMVGDPEAVIDLPAAGMRLVPNSNLRWAVLRDVPPGHFPGSGPMNRREVNYATVTRAELRFGMPCIDFGAGTAARTSWDFRFIPYGRARLQYGPNPWDVAQLDAAGDTLHSEHFAREFAVFNRLSAAMTRFAFCATYRSGRAIRRPWAIARPRRWSAERVEWAADQFPEPFIGFRMHDADDVFRRAVSARSVGRAIPCRRCGRHLDVEAFIVRADALHVRTAGCEQWLADCPACRQRQKWRAADVVPAKHEFHVPLAFMNRFCNAVANGVPLKAVAPSVYCGATTFMSQRDWPNLPDARSRGLDLVPHRFVNRMTGLKSLVYLPKTARVVATDGQALAPGKLWAYAMSGEPPRTWCSKDSAARWRSLPETIGDSAHVTFLQDVWLRHQAVMHEDLGEHQFVLPTELASFVGRAVKPIGLYWDLARLNQFWDTRTGSAILPPLILGRWDRLRCSLPGDVLLDASLFDPRFSMSSISVERHVRAVEQVAA